MESGLTNPPALIGTGAEKGVTSDGWADIVFAFHDSEEIGPRMLARIARNTGLLPEDL
jgi:hypothetical protein